MKSLLLISLLFSLNSFGAIVYTEQPGIYKKYISSNKTVKYKLVQSNATKEQLIAFAKGVLAMHSKEVDLL